MRLSLRCSLVALAAASLALAACGDGGPDSSSPSLGSSPAILTSPPEAYSQTWLGTVDCYAKHTEPEIVMTSDAEERVLATPGVGVLWLGTWLIDDVLYVLAGTVSATGEYTLTRWRDSNADGFLDAATATTLFTTATPCYLTVIRRVSNGALYCLDARCQDIVLVRDLNSDGWPETVAPQFARSADYAPLLDAYDIQVLSVSKIRVSQTPIAVTQLGGVAVTHTLEDTNSDRVADVLVAEPLFERIPHFANSPYVGETQVRVLGGAGSTGKTVRLFQLNAAGDEVSELGTCALGGMPGDAVSEGTITVTGGLTLDSSLSIRFSDAVPFVADRRAVGPAVPEILSMSPVRTDEGVAATRTLTGKNFTSGMSLALVKPDKTTQSVTFTFTDTQHVTISIPALTVGDCNNVAWLIPTVPGQNPEENGAHTFRFEVNPP